MSAFFDPIAVSARIVLALQSLPGRQLDARLPSVVSIGAIHGGVRGNIIPDEVSLLGTIRSLAPSQQPELHRRIRQTAGEVGQGGEVGVGQHGQGGGSGRLWGLF